MASERESEVGDRASQMGEASEGAMATEQIMHRILILSRLIRHFLRSLSLSLTHTHTRTNTWRRRDLDIRPIALLWLLHSILNS